MAEFDPQTSRCGRRSTSAFWVWMFFFFFSFQSPDFFCLRCFQGPFVGESFENSTQLCFVRFFFHSRSWYPKRWGENMSAALICSCHSLAGQWEKNAVLLVFSGWSGTDPLKPLTELDVWRWNNKFSQVKTWNHPIERTLYKWMFQVSGSQNDIYINIYNKKYIS